jgi:Na+-transporting NADH:ubiquinone oxidoreductase subunit C
MNKDSNSYTVIYASAMVVLVAVLLAFTSESLRSFQKKNETNDKRQQILRSVNIHVSGNEAEKKFNELIKESFLINDKGQKVDGDAFAVESSKMAGKNMFPVFVAEIDGAKKYILAMYGAGMWGSLWGYIALNEDRNTVFGVDFSHQGETPGLGAEIALPAFSSQFTDKQLFKNGEFKSIAVVKHGKSVQGQDYVDGISGGSITSISVNNMLRNSLSHYVEFFKNN